MSLIPDSKTGLPIPWGDSTIDRFYVDLEPLLHGKDAKVVSDANLTNVGRSKAISFNTYSDNPHHRVTMVVTQGPDSLVTAVFDETTASIYNNVKAGFSEGQEHGN